MRYLKNSIFLVLATLLFNTYLLWGCAKKEVPVDEKSTIEKEFIKSFESSHKLDYRVRPHTKIVGKTFWIYATTEEEIISAEARETQTLPPRIIKFIEVDCEYKNSIFSIDYIFLKYRPERYSLHGDREKEKRKDLLQETPLAGKEIYPEPTDKLREIFNKVYFTIGDIIGDANEINFFVICIADIKRGIKSTYVAHKLDLEKSLLRMLPDEEFSNRLFRRNSQSPEIKNDVYGLHINYVDISLIDFITEQIEMQVLYKVYDMQMYEAKKLVELENLDEIIFRSVYDRAVNYEFYDFYLVEVEDLITKSKSSIGKSRLIATFERKSPDNLIIKDPLASDE